MISYKKVHNYFRINGQHYKKDDMLSLASEFIKDGNPFERSFGLFVLDWFDNSNQIKLKTSGTTGSPKEIVVQKQAMVLSALATGDFFGLRPKDRALCCLPINFIAGKMMLVRAFILGLDMDFVEPTASPLDNISSDYDFCAMTPMQVSNSLSKLNQIKKLIIGGAKVEQHLESELLKIPTLSYETYASTETLTHIAVRRIGELYFKMLPDISVTVDDRDCLVIHAPRISENPIVTNDRVNLCSDGGFEWLGRIDHVVNSGGIKLFPEQIESKLKGKIPYRFFIGGLPDLVLGEKLVLVIESDKYKISENIFEVLDSYEKPKAIYFVEKFIETESGKIRRGEVLQNLKVQEC